jgi:cyclopropane fatty-acyl-phospholipid synthase-like methyltransferase
MINQQDECFFYLSVLLLGLMREKRASSSVILSRIGVTGKVTVLDIGCSGRGFEKESIFVSEETDRSNL